ncbi:glycosyltransferase, group 1 family protein [Neobacillus bataviensis LMG 21833]|uniref:Glycosyltransferase, group 1 family protein n=1 Tax=Neobacillus bataviensis LMG 21833 TaxID=1117379 RepID=K6DDR4_9BACI|nr:glycosyltransferase family 4 protein [Neobacillus bataviensis]EKN66449.1 glycosyltransferase, group 1 family protein [Neobacillus bataviensis LMG 21833]
MKINFVNLSNVLGGQELYLYNIVLKLQSIYDIRLFIKNSIFSEEQINSLEKIEIVYVSSIDYREFKKIKNEILNRTLKDDVFIFNGNRAIYLGALFPMSYKKIAIQHSSIIDQQDGVIKKIFRKSLYKVLLNNYVRLIGVSYNTISPIASKSKVSVIHNGIDTAKFYPINEVDKMKLRSRLRFEKDKKILVMVGVFTDNKGQLEALKIIENLSDDFLLILVGDGPDLEMAKAYVQEKQLLEKVTFTGKTSNVIDYYGISDALLFLSKNEGLPLTILEAMASGLPIFTTNVGGIKEVVKNNENGFFLDRNNIPENVTLIKNLFEKTSLLQKISRNNVIKIQENFTLNKNIELLMQELLFHKK